MYCALCVEKLCGSAELTRVRGYKLLETILYGESVYMESLSFYVTCMYRHGQCSHCVHHYFKDLLYHSLMLILLLSTCVQVKESEKWLCYMCSEEHSHVGLLEKREDWDKKLRELFLNDHEMEYVCVPIYRAL